MTTSLTLSLKHSLNYWSTSFIKNILPAYQLHKFRGKPLIFFIQDWKKKDVLRPQLHIMTKSFSYSNQQPHLNNSNNSLQLFFGAATN